MFLLELCPCLHHCKGKYEEADSLYLRSIDIVEKSLGSDHPVLAIALSNRGGLLMMLVRVVFPSVKSLCAVFVEGRSESRHRCFGNVQVGEPLLTFYCPTTYCDLGRCTGKIASSAA